MSCGCAVTLYQPARPDLDDDVCRAVASPKPNHLDGRRLIVRLCAGVPTAALMNVTAVHEALGRRVVACRDGAGRP